MAPRVVERRDPRSRVLQDHDLSRVAGRFVAWGGLLYLAVRVVELGFFWTARRGAPLEAELAALAHTAEALPGLVLATALVYTGLWILRSDSLLAFRVLAGWVSVLAIGAAVLVGLVALDYLALASTASLDARAAYGQTASEAVLVGGMGVLFLVPLGVAGFRTRRRFR